MHRAAILPHRQNRQDPMKQPDAASWRLSNPNLRSGSYTVTQRRPWHLQGYSDYWPDYWPFCAVLLWTQDYCYQWNQSVSWMLADGVSTQLTSSPPQLQFKKFILIKNNYLGLNYVWVILLQAILLYFLLYFLLYLIIWKNRPFDLQYAMRVICRSGRFYLYKRVPRRFYAIETRRHIYISLKTDT